MNQNTELRKMIRKQRRSLTPLQQRNIEQQCLKQFLKHSQLQYAKKVGVYLDAFGEVRTRLVIEFCFQHGKQVYLPIICNMNKTLRWVKISKHQFRNQLFSRHPLGMLEPIANRGLHISTLDLVIMPLLACDNRGTRMGMGGGFYDRTLASALHRPYRLGLAHDFQKLDVELKRNPWDQALDGLITPSKSYRFKRQISQ
ncbi:5-formyltetrahydrofolate cyclo-ligase [Acinetobacter sp. WCHAc060025]|uniref:5-formyltetrahydrofolate cyclo-ligase n=1 Tax=Acinetobacter sp. WCHAc060025 TaxID=2518625 RepID=UPI001023AB11|nr:5-formyltetrahydrofolate cyclo-ligase [Acinetobacter sp. WCHAc060025]RZG71808.1 5-formyltetrahydrofolate cyclo-ligase [Acinetobacter sp. WCHAc060025]